jgi:ribosomal protein L29
MKRTEELKKMKSLSVANLKLEIAKVKKELGILRLEVQANKVQDFSKVGVLRKNIARLHTIQNNLPGESK